MLLKFGWYLDFFMYLNAMTILDICRITCTKNREMADVVTQDSALKKQESRSKNKEGKAVSIS
ncbi:MAG: hypothetical protein EAZ78_07615 [Oscillatoriales cyanobacterium]|nr:MAG: hypothetical protein EA000_25035 [Oscillatoriales cyanobacterium]TAD93353.1 MAG: hypothetical protein EAZ98_23165 [Oscillatoriales cyanobacterium]TAE03790.1 MAG: hypothetical protein EAZ96_11630 [Oscillatoriales cyanobacterium]TAF04828.1 MAG: hypothetical protein EAZ78_07615 [Oscillatoriales cyanobacterium]TAF70348.1 MAG: hypothetical protein EAZ59_05105 [Oscillatoriales cyanobacterium]